MKMKEVPEIIQDYIEIKDELIEEYGITSTRDVFYEFMRRNPEEDPYRISYIFRNTHIFR